MANRSQRLEKLRSMSVDDVEKRWRNLLIGNTIAAVFASAVAFIFWREPWPVLLALLMAFGVYETRSLGTKAVLIHKRFLDAQQAKQAESGS